MNKISSSAANAREQARRKDGKFGEQTHEKADGIDLYVADSDWMSSDDNTDDAPAIDGLDRFDWDPMTEDPAVFDEHLTQMLKDVARARSAKESAEAQLHRRLGHVRGRYGYHQKLDDETMAPLRSHKSPAVQAEVARYDQADEAFEQAKQDVNTLDEVWRERGAWNRAFLATSADGHVHSSLHCSTCRPTTQFALMTDYSDKSEDEIVEAAGYRACTVCYPSAPVGDEKTLPTRILTDEEKRKLKERQEREAFKAMSPQEQKERKRRKAAEKRAAEKAAKLERAATKDGKPIVFTDVWPDGKERVSKIFEEKDALREYRGSLMEEARVRRKDAEGTVVEGMEALHESDRARAELKAGWRGRIVEALAQKHGRTVAEQKEILDAESRERFKDTDFVDYVRFDG